MSGTVSTVADIGNLFNLDVSALKRSGTGDTHTVTAGSTTNVFINTTFDGSTGSTAYTVGDIVKALKQVGILAP